MSIWYILPVLPYYTLYFQVPVIFYIRGECNRLIACMLGTIIDPCCSLEEQACNSVQPRILLQDEYGKIHTL